MGAQTAIDLCNSALQRVGATKIMSLTDNSREARACNVAYDSNRRDELRKHPWAFAKKRAVLAPDTDAPAFDFTYQFTLPSDCLRIIRPAEPSLDWQLEGRKILTNDGNVLYLTYISDVEDVAQFDPSFYNVMAAALALDICEVLTQSNVKYDRLSQDYKQAVAIARRMNAFESGPVSPVDDDWWVARL